MVNDRKGGEFELRVMRHLDYYGKAREERLENGGRNHRIWLGGGAEYLTQEWMKRGCSSWFLKETCMT